MREIKVNRLCEEALLPKKATSGSVGSDIFACITEPITILPGERYRVPTGLVMELPPNHGAFIFARSGLSSKHGIDLANGVGVIDSDYRGEVQVALRNTGTEPYTVRPGERIAQIIILPVPIFNFIEANQIDETERGTGGFGSTGIYK